MNECVELDTVKLDVPAIRTLFARAARQFETRRDLVRESKYDDQIAKDLDNLVGLLQSAGEGNAKAPTEQKLRLLFSQLLDQTRLIVSRIIALRASAQGE